MSCPSRVAAATRHIARLHYGHAAFRGKLCTVLPQAWPPSNHFGTGTAFGPNLTGTDNFTVPGYS